MKQVAKDGISEDISTDTEEGSIVPNDGFGDLDDEGNGESRVEVM